MLRSCTSSDQARELIGVIRKSGNRLSADSFMPLVDALLVEGDAAAARRVVDEEMADAPATAKHMRKRMAFLTGTRHHLDRMRTTRLQQLLSSGSDDATTAAWVGPGFPTHCLFKRCLGGRSVVPRRNRRSGARVALTIWRTELVVQVGGGLC
jgi:hypothetical protein